MSKENFLKKKQICKDKIAKDEAEIVKLNSHIGKSESEIFLENPIIVTLLKTKKFNISMLDESAPMSLFEHFGFQSGKSVNKFETAVYGAKKSENEVYYLTEHTNAYISAYVTDSIDLGTHTLFIATVVKAEKLADTASATYEYYFKNIKPAPAPQAKGWVCKICGYVYEGEVLPDDFICPLCKHPASDFERIL